jgi:hypothetical protein
MDVTGKIPQWLDGQPLCLPGYEKDAERAIVRVSTSVARNDKKKIGRSCPRGVDFVAVESETVIHARAGRRHASRIGAGIWFGHPKGQLKVA